MEVHFACFWRQPGSELSVEFGYCQELIGLESHQVVAGGIPVVEDFMSESLGTRLDLVEKLMEKLMRKQAEHS